MEKAKVYLTDFRTNPRMNMIKKMQNLLKKAGIEQIPFKDQLVAIKIHFGEPGNISYIRPDYAAIIVEMIKELGGKPFVTDANTLYSGKRSNAIDHLDTASRHGYNPLSVGCNVIIADGLKGTEYREIPVNGEYCQTAKIGSAIADADIVISVNHVKGHDLAGFGGALKNLGMGSGSRGGKLEMHSSSKPEIKKENCTACSLCIKHCPQQAISLENDKKAEIDYDLCFGCGQCVALCRFGAAHAVYNESTEIMVKKIAEYAQAVLKDKPHFHINFIMGVSPNCDCWTYNDLPIVPDLGIAASFDPVALDRASVDLINAAPPLAGSVMTENYYQAGDDKFGFLYPKTNWQVGLEHAEEIGIGTQEYELIRI